MRCCNDKLARMSEAIDGRLNAGTLAELMAHLESCAACRREFEELRRTVCMLQAVPTVDAPPDMAARVRRRLERRKTPRFAWPVLNSPPARVVLAASFLIGLSIYAFRHTATRTGDARPVEYVEQNAEATDQEAFPETIPFPAPPAEFARRIGRDELRALENGDFRAKRRRELAVYGVGPSDKPYTDTFDVVQTDTAAEAADALAAANNVFAVDLYRELAVMQGGNLFFSPYGISSALGMTCAGARGNTAREMLAAMRWPLGRADLPPAFRELDRRLMFAARDSNQKLNIANGLCLTGHDVDAAYRNLLRDYYKAEIFSGGLDEINSWVARKTSGLVENILAQLPRESVCVILNAIYFKGVWQHRFASKDTRDAAFYVSPERRSTVSLMHREGRYRLLEDRDFQAVSIPYQNDKLSMIVFLPREDTDLETLEKQFTASSLEEWRAALDRQPERRVRLYLPKFKLETGYDLVPPARRLGIRDAFVEGVADFTAMGGLKGELWISQIKHRAYVSIDEEGTEAAAATAVDMHLTSLQPPIPVFRADRPFIFLIQDNETGSILFMGRLLDPAVED